MIALLFFISIPSFAVTKEIKLSTLNWEPYVGEKLVSEGIMSEIVRAALNKEGYSLKLEFYPWARALLESEKASAGIDGTLGAYYDKLKEEKYVFSDPIFDSPVGLYIRKVDKSKINYKVEKDLNKTYARMKNLSFGIVRSYVNEEKFDANKTLNKKETNSDENNIKKLLAGRIDTIFIDKYVALHLFDINSEIRAGKSQLMFLTPPIHVHKLFIIWSKAAADYKLKVKMFNDGLKKLKNSGEFKKIQQKYEQI